MDTDLVIRAQRGEISDPRSASCHAFFDYMITILGGEPNEFGPIIGTLQLAP